MLAGHDANNWKLIDFPQDWGVEFPDLEDARNSLRKLTLNHHDRRGAENEVVRLGVPNAIGVRVDKPLPRVENPSILAFEEPFRQFISHLLLERQTPPLRALATARFRPRLRAR